MLVFGTRLYGQIDYIPEHDIYVATEFAHLWYIPLIPTRGYIVTETHANGWQGKETGVYFRSVLAAWSRAALLVAGVVAGISAIACGQVLAGIGLGVLACGLIAAMWASYQHGPFGHAGAEARADLEREFNLQPGSLAAPDLQAQWYSDPNRPRQ